MLLTAAACLSACDAADDAPASLSTTAAPVAGAAVNYAQKYADTAPTFDAQLNAVSVDNPGFKGIVGSEDGTEVIVLVDQVTAQRGGSSGLASALASRLGIDAGRLSFETASAVAGKAGMPATDRPDFHVLYDAKNGLRRFMFESDLVSYLDLDETTGRVVVGTHTDAQAAAVRAAMTPDELAVSDFIRSPEITPAVADVSAETVSSSSSFVNRSLRNSAFRPLIAGAETEFRTPAGAGTACSQGPAVRFSDGTYGFLSNAHCTLDRTRIDGVMFYQPLPVQSDLIGIEAAEPAYRSGWFVHDGYYSDAAFVRTQANVELRGQMTNSDNCGTGSGACTENGIITDVTGTSSYLPVNTRVFKTGRTTGSTAGRISSTCFDTTPSGESRKILCSSIVTYDSSIPSPTTIVGAGDSGSAVLVNGGVPSLSGGTLAGILWGSNGSQSFVFSPWENIWQGERAGTAYGLPVQVVTNSQGAVKNATSGGGGTGGGGTGGGGGGGGGGCPDTNAGGEWGTTREPAPCPQP